MESLQLSQVLADLSNLGAAEPEAAAAIVNANSTVIHTDIPKISIGAAAAGGNTPSPTPSQQGQRPSSMLKRAWSTEPGPVDKFGRRIMVASTGSRPGSTTTSAPGTPRRGDSPIDEDLERAATLMALYDIRARLKHQDNSSLLKAREKVNALAAKQQAQQAAERSAKAADELRRNRYSFPKPGL